MKANKQIRILAQLLEVKTQIINKPSDIVDIEVIKPLSLQDIAIHETVKLDKQSIANLLGVPSFLLGVGEFDKEEFNNFISTYESYYGVSDRFGNSTSITLKVCPHCECDIIDELEEREEDED